MGVGSATFFLCTKINPKSHYQEKEKKKVSVWRFAALAINSSLGSTALWVHRI